jgi:CheY-like chemotaxis protein
MSNKIRVVNSTRIFNQTDDTASACKETRTGLKILIVDDDKNSGESLRDIIRYRGHSVTLLDEGMKFVNRMNEEEFDLIFMDYHTNEINPDAREADRTISMMGDDDSDMVDDEDTCSESREADSEVSDGSEKEEITGTYVTKLARECYNFDTPVFAYTGDSSSEAIQDFQDSNFKGVFVKPVDAQLINSFFEIMEREYDQHDSLTTFTGAANTKLRRLAMKNNNFIFFRKRRPKVTRVR